MRKNIRMWICSLMIMIVFVMTVHAQPILNIGKLKGVVLFYFNENYGYKPDIGASVYILNKKHLKFVTNGIRGSISWDTLVKFQKIKTCLALKKIYASNGGELNEDCNILLKSMGVTDDESFKIFTEKVSENQILLMDINNYTKSYTVDGSGNYSAQLPEGEYCILIKSNGRKDLNVAEVRGKFITKEVVIKNGRESIFDAKFELR